MFQALIQNFTFRLYICRSIPENAGAMKHCFFYFLILCSLVLKGQINYNKQNINLISLISPNSGAPGIDGRYYSGCWGWYQQSKNKEYAISGTSNGTYFIDVSNPSTPSVCAFVAGKPNCTWREEKTYKNYCYIISDDPPPNKFQIVDLQYLPDSVHMVYNDTTLFEHAHTLWVDNNKLYVGLVTYPAGHGFSPMNVYSLATPTAPVLLRQVQQDLPVLTEVHDMFARNDTVYCSNGYAGLFVIKFDTLSNTFTQLGSYSNYNSPAYNHSSSLTKDGRYLLFCDEVPAAKPMHLVDVQNLANIQPVQSFKPYLYTTPHNPYVMGNYFAVVACYADGLFIYDISQPGNAVIAGYFDTHPQSGDNLGAYYSNDYVGNWGAYPYLPSGIIIAQDMQNGVFILDGSAAFSHPLGLAEQNADADGVHVYPNPASSRLAVTCKTRMAARIQLTNPLGQVVYESTVNSPVDEVLDVQHLANGSYLLTVIENTQRRRTKIIVQH